MGLEVLGFWQLKLSQWLLDGRWACDRTSLPVCRISDRATLIHRTQILQSLRTSGVDYLQWKPSSNKSGGTVVLSELAGAAQAMPGLQLGLYRGQVFHGRGIARQVQHLGNSSPRFNLLLEVL